ncbi:tellurite resistance TerB family protein [Prosthecomicrobium sp. N25]|uniref:tellurite resistance TerB family protein n=1 Tax=Prosthecomicrobium sp. N25 TaxID=3129254 RepID=UPI0030773567
MFDAKKLLDALVGPEGAQRADQVLGRGLDAARRGATDVFGNEAVDRAQDYVKGNAETLIAGAAGGLLGLLVGTKTGRSVAGAGLKLGTLAAVGGLAWKAYQNWQASQPGAAGTGPDAPAALPESDQQALARTLIVAMIAAAKADGIIDPKEYRTIAGKAAEAGIDPEASAFLEAEMSSPLDIEKVVAGATSPEIATQIYAASCLAIAPDKNSEIAYLAELAGKLGLDPALRAEIDRRVAEARTA